MEEYEHEMFYFLEFAFMARRSKNRWGKFFIKFIPAISERQRRVSVYLFFPHHGLATCG
jgi:hypothetical protein